MKPLQYLEVSDIAKAPVFTYFRSGSRDLDEMRHNEAKQALLSGYEPAVKAAEQFLSRIENDLPEPQSGGFETILDHHGSRVMRSRWLSGHPRPCFRRVRRQHDLAPIKVVVGTFVSCGIDAQAYMRRGEAIIAFLMLLQRVRPVELYVSVETKDNNEKPRYALVHLESKPINLSQVGFIIGHVAYSRVCEFGWETENWKDVPLNIPAPDRNIPRKRGHLGLVDEDIYINSAVLGDALLIDPEAWIKNEMSRIMRSLQPED